MRYRIEKTIVDTNRAVASWEEDTWFDGSNHISKATGSQWTHETLYKTRKGRYWIEHSSQLSETGPHAEWVSPQEATRWLLTNGCNVDDIPDDLTQYIDDVME